MAIMQNGEQILSRVEEGVMAKAEDKQVTLRIITAGMKVMFDKKTHNLMIDQINKPGDLIENVGEGIANLIAILYQQSRGTMPLKAAVPASVVLLCHALDYLAKAGKIEISNEVVAQATKAMMAYLMQKMGISPDKMQAMKGAAQ